MRRWRDPSPSLRRLRLFTLIWTVIPLLFLLKVLFLTAGSAAEGAAVGRWSVIAGVVGILGLLASQVLASRPLRRRGGGSLAAAFAARFFLRFAFVEAGLLLGFAGALSTSDPAPYLVGMAPYWVGLALLAPTDAAIERTTVADGLSGASLRESLDAEDHSST